MKGYILAGLILVGSFALPVLANHFHHNNVAVIKQKVVQFDSRYYTGLDGYFRVGEQLRQKYPQINDGEIADKIKDLEKKLEGTNIRLDTLLKILAGEKDETVEVKPETPKVNTPEETTSESDESDDLDEQVHRIFSQNCKQCHSDNGKAGLTLVKGDTLVIPPLAMMDLIVHLCEGVDLEEGEVRMPQGSAPLSDADIKTLKRWRMREAKLLLGGDS